MRAEFFPEVAAVLARDPQPAPPATPDETARTVYFLMLVAQVMEDVWLACELDTYWAQAGGADPAGYCARLSGRLPLLHLKDYVISPKNEPVTAALGEGNLSIPIILREAEMADCHWYIVEQEDAADPFADIATSYRYLKSLAS